MRGGATSVASSPIASSRRRVLQRVDIDRFGGRDLTAGDRFLTPRCYTAVKALLMAACLALPTSAQAQTAPADGTLRAWAGYDTFRYRDTAKSSPPVDASPVAWRGAGPILGLDWDRERPFRLHRVNVAFSAAGGFVYDTGIGTIPRPEEESARLLEGGYEYRRYFARAIGIRSLHAGIGVRGGGERRAFERRRGGNELTATTSAGSIAGVAALRFRPAGRVSADVEWGNAAVLTRERLHLVAGTESEMASWGGGWFTDLTARVNVRLAERTSLAVAYGRRGEGWLFDLRAYTDERRRIVAGVTHVR